jgi:hypothetical protein
MGIVLDTTITGKATLAQEVQAEAYSVGIITREEATP